MSAAPAKISLAQWDARYRELLAAGLEQPSYGGPLQRHVEQEGDRRLLHLQFDNSPAALRLWNFLLTEEDRLAAARAGGHKLVGAMKDLGTVPVMAYSLPNLTAFYPDGAWWIPCLMELDEGLLATAADCGLGESMCPVRAMVGAFLTQAHFPLPDLLLCSTGATCDDFSAIAQRLEGMGFPILWWEMPHRRRPDPGEPAVPLPGGLTAPRPLVDFVARQLEMVKSSLESLAGAKLTDDALAEGIERANRFRRLLAELRRLTFTAPAAPLPALELLISEMLAIHFCSDQAEATDIIAGLLAETRRRVDQGLGVLDPGAARVFWVNPVADLRAMNLLEECGGRLCGSDFMFAHALDEIPTDCPPLEALARSALADPMVGSAGDRAERICRDIAACGAQAVVISRIPGASHCATEGRIIGQIVHDRLKLPVAEIEVPPVMDPVGPGVRTRLEALVETVRRSPNDGQRNDE